MSQFFRSRTRRWACAAAVALLALPVFGCGALETVERQAIFQPTRSAEISRWGGAPPAGAQDVWIDVGQDGERLHGLWTPAVQDSAHAPSVLFLHGARRNLVGVGFRIAGLVELGFNVLAIDYRGFGRSDGTLPSEELAYEDAQAAWHWLRHKAPDPARRLVYGHSLGGAIAIDLATRVDDLAGVAVESTFTSIPDVAANLRFGWLPMNGLITQRFESLEKVGRVQVPMLYVHGTADRIVPDWMADRLFAATRAPKRLFKVDGGNHSRAMLRDQAGYRAAVRAWLEDVRQTRRDG